MSTSEAAAEKHGIIIFTVARVHRESEVEPQLLTHLRQSELDYSKTVLSSRN